MPLNRSACAFSSGSTPGLNRLLKKAVLALSCWAKSEATDGSAIIVLFRNRHEMGEGRGGPTREKSAFAHGFL